MRVRPTVEIRRIFVSVLCCAAFIAQGLAQETESAPKPEGPDAAAVTSSDATVSIGLDECLAASLAGAPGLKTAKLSLDTGSAQLAYAIGSNGLTLGESAGYLFQWPTGSASSSTTLSNSSGVYGNNVQAGASLSGPSTSLGVSVQPGFPTAGGLSTAVSITGKQVVYDGYPGGRPTGLVKQARYSFQIAQVTYDAALESLAYQVKQAYYTLLGDQNGLIARQATVKQAQEELSQMQGYHKAGRATTLDILQFQVALTQAQLDLRTQQNAIESDRKKLSLAVGWPLDKAYIVSEVSSPSPPDLDPKQALETAFKNRPELKNLDLNIEYADVDLSLQKSQFSPVVSINGGLGLQQDLTPDTLGAGTISLGATIALPPIYDGKQQASLVRQKANAIANYNVLREQERQSITIDVQNALFSVMDASDRFDLAKQNLEQTQGVYDMQRAKFRAGLASSVDVMTAFAALATAQVGLETSKATYNLAILNLYNVMGQ
ncbi:MAG: TolC family protein [Rectinemataceae bacterium]|jgi:outer membrane protein TolC